MSCFVVISVAQRWVGRQLSDRLFLTLEVAIEYWLALGAYKTQIPLLVEEENARVFNEEVKAEAKMVRRNGACGIVHCVGTSLYGQSTLWGMRGQMALS